MPVKNEIYSKTTLDWCKQKVEDWMTYVDANPFHKLVDRIEWKPTSKGGLLPMVIATKESQIKCLRDTMKEALIMLEHIRKIEDRVNSTTLRGDVDMPEMMKE